MQKDFYLCMEEKKKTAERLLARIKRELKRLPSGKLVILVSKKKYAQYYLVTKANGKEKRSYIPKSEIKLVEQLAQRAYYEKMKRALERILNALEVTLHILKENEPMEVFRKGTPARQALITPLIPTDEQYIEQWYQEHPGDRNSCVKTTAYTTIRGETVRSKSEKMIADAYYMAGVPYVYEPTVILPNGRTRYPDFAVLNVRLRRTYYHEHLGMMDDEEYRQNAILRMREYNKNGFPVGEQMIVTFEGENIPFDQEELAEIIQAYLQ